jgi:hypothetical protein
MTSPSVGSGGGAAPPLDFQKARLDSQEPAAALERLILKAENFAWDANDPGLTAQVIRDSAIVRDVLRRKR